MALESLITQISYLSFHDGPGVRTTVFFKGCLLKCSWCHNPETINPSVEMEWKSRLCIACMKCEDICPSSAIKVAGNGYIIDKDRCSSCYKCVEACPSSALSLVAKEYTAEQLLDSILKDKELIQMLGGGVTFSGGEPALQAPFIRCLVDTLKREGLHIALDTSGQAPWSAYELLLPHIDLLLFDIKEIQSSKHKIFTGAGNEKILQNLLNIASYIRANNLPVRIWIRTPLIPDMTATLENIKEIGIFISENISDLTDKWELCTFNNLCVDKYRQLGLKWSLLDKSLLTEDLRQDLLSVALQTAHNIKMVTSTGLIKK